MKTIDINTQTTQSRILIGESLANAAAYLPQARVMIITDANVKALYQDAFPKGEVLEIGLGEGHKTLETLKHLYARMIELEADRSCFILGIGGGIVCDVAGFLASTYMRGLRFGFVSSTLLAQVDASVGGKNGVNFGGYKNMVGVFNQPEFVICDLGMLKTLPEKELRCGFAEIIKHGAIGDATTFSWLEENCARALALEPNAVEKLVWESVKVKAGVVSQDETEKGERRKLNFGHTFGHAIEKTTGMPHGEAVAIGMRVAAQISQNRGLISEGDAQRVIALIRNMGLPVDFEKDKNSVLEALKKDKKRAGNRIHFVLLKALGEALVESIEIRELEEVLF